MPNPFNILLTLFLLDKMDKNRRNNSDNQDYGIYDDNNDIFDDVIEDSLYNDSFLDL